ncbi:MAG: T9SS type A sorting domain-containing protein [Flavobacteriaceae bacterium]|nr:T9SS type A sorting domain-containing protein [Flavobacteriaceae bacterium]
MTKANITFSFFLLFLANANAQLVSTYIGQTGKEGYDLSTQYRDSAYLNGPWGMAFDTNSNLYITEYFGHRIKMVTTDGSSVYIRSGSSATLEGDRGYDEAAAGQAKWYSPGGIAMDKTTNSLVVADRDNHCIRRLSPYVNATNSQISSFIAGGTDITESGYANGTTFSARFDQPYDLAVAADGIIYVADAFNHCIRKIDEVNDEVTTFAGNGTKGFKDGQDTSARFFLPCGICWDPNGDLLVADRYTYRIRKVNVASSPIGMVSTVAGSNDDDVLDGPISTATFKLPTDVACDKKGNIYVCEANNSTGGDRVNVIRKISNGKVTTIAGQNNTNGTANGLGVNARFDMPVSLLLDKSETMLFVADLNNHAIRTIHLWPLGISELMGNTYESTLEFFPNPTNGDYLNVSTDFEMKSIRITDLSGRILMTEQMKGKQAGLSIGVMANGVYILTVAGTDGQQVSKKLLVK